MFLDADTRLINFDVDLNSMLDYANQNDIHVIVHLGDFTAQIVSNHPDCFEPRSHKKVVCGNARQDESQVVENILVSLQEFAGPSVYVSGTTSYCGRRHAEQ